MHSQGSFMPDEFAEAIDIAVHADKAATVRIIGRFVCE